MIETTSSEKMEPEEKITKFAIDKLGAENVDDVKSKVKEATKLDFVKENLSEILKILEKKEKEKTFKSIKYWIIGTVIFVSGIVLLSFPISDNETLSESALQSKTQKNRETQPAKSVIKITAVQLFKEYEANEIAADKKYEDKILEVTGVIGSFGKEILGKPYVTFKTGEYEFDQNVQAVFYRTEEEKLLKLKKGQTIKVSCTSPGRITISVILDKCSIKSAN